MDLKDATLMFLTESAAYPAVAELARSAYDRLAEEGDIDYRVLDELVGEASGKGVLRAMRQKYGPVAFESIVGPVTQQLSHHLALLTEPGLVAAALCELLGRIGPTGLLR